jgi:hypothetical protein
MTASQDCQAFASFRIPIHSGARAAHRLRAG